MDNNALRICEKCADSRHERWQQENKDLEIKPGMYVKLKFTQGEQSEHMWVKVTKCLNHGKYRGTLDNDPVYLTRWKDKDPVTFTFEEIEQHLEE
jgi:uncharacterized protein YegJ (DUF2314 family)